MLTGQAKTDYQREYMRKRRTTVRPKTESIRPAPVRPADVVRPDKRTYANSVLCEPVSTTRTYGPLTKERQLSSKGFNE